MMNGATRHLRRSVCERRVCSDNARCHSVVQTKHPMPNLDIKRDSFCEGPESIPGGENAHHTEVLRTVCDQDAILAAAHHLLDGFAHRCALAAGWNRTCRLHDLRDGAGIHGAPQLRLRRQAADRARQVERGQDALEVPGLVLHQKMPAREVPGGVRSHHPARLRDLHPRAHGERLCEDTWHPRPFGQQPSTHRVISRRPLRVCLQDVILRDGPDHAPLAARDDAGGAVGEHQDDCRIPQGAAPIAKSLPMLSHNFRHERRSSPWVMWWRQLLPMRAGARQATLLIWRHLCRHSSGPVKGWCQCLPERGSKRKETESWSLEPKYPRS
mmetsp:Transcript_152778/g.490066  ORF Transcript_152778/g.490066 Transcript_152778/m.490066 type:complete len:327 (-) Transcript_152778:21-1001(-)